MAKKVEKLGSWKSGIGLTISEMSDAHFKSHLDRVLSKMQAKGVDMDKMKAASIRISVRRQEALTD